jgi:calcineurin-like phosphoesterase family protein
MNETIIANHNARVEPNDIVYFLGDWGFKNSSGGKKGEGLPINPTTFLDRLNGRYVFIKGNHDKNNGLKTILEKCIINYANTKVCLVHNPIHADWEYKYNFIGHVHEKWKFRTYYSDKTHHTYLINVGVDAWDFKPVSFEEIMKAFKKWRKTDEEAITREIISAISKDI